MCNKASLGTSVVVASLTAPRDWVRCGGVQLQQVAAEINEDLGYDAMRYIDSEKPLDEALSDDEVASKACQCHPPSCCLKPWRSIDPRCRILRATAFVQAVPATSATSSS